MLESPTKRECAQSYHVGGLLPRARFINFRTKVAHDPVLSGGMPRLEFSSISSQLIGCLGRPMAPFQQGA